MKKLISSILFLITGMNLFGQGSITLSTAQAAGGTQTACSQILLKPGFSYSATGSNSLVLKVDAATCNPYGGTTESFSATQNYILTRTYTTEDGSRYLDQVQYFDGLGRPVQTVQRGITPTTKDLVTLQEYDAYGREGNSWLPAVISGNNGAYVNPATVKTTAVSSNGSDQKPYSMPVYEASPLNRVLKQFGPGADWQNNSKAVETAYKTNVSGDARLNCILYKAGGTNQAPVLSKSDNYTTGQLYVTEMKDEDGNVSYEFRDKLGQVVLTRQVDNGENHDTYYVYNDWGNLCFVLPPKIKEKGVAENITQANLNLLAYQYKYDDRNRCTWKRLPGCEPIYYVYDKADRLIFTQDGEMRAKGEWLFAIPDAFGRIAVTGTCKNSMNYAANPLGSNVVKIARSNATNTYKGYATPTGVTLSTPVTILSVNYYDDYAFIGYNGIPNNDYANYNAESGYATRYTGGYKGLLTGTLTAQMKSDGTVDNSAYLYSVMYYDNKGQLIQTKSTNHLTGGYEKEYIAYNFTGQPVKRKHVHMATGKNTQTEVYAYSYDHAGRLLKTTHQLTDGASTKAMVTLAENSYDELGRLKTNKKGGQANLNTTYAYNVRSWTKSISSPLFSQTLFYNDRVTAHSYSDYKQQYNGNISGMEWQVSGESKRSYRFHYDNLSRLTHAGYNGATSGGMYNVSYTYDKHGNIKNMTRRGKSTKATDNNVVVDQLTMDYSGNQLTKVTDAVANFALAESADFKNYGGTNGRYTYNTNGAMKTDSHKGVLGINYNSLNLPCELAVKNTNAVGKTYYIYSAGGQKLQTVHKSTTNMTYTPVLGLTSGDSNFNVTTTTDYVGNKVYENGALKRVLVDGGYIEAGVYHYYQNDHLGNNRMVASANGTAIQKNHYYPFGMAFAEGTTQEQGKQPYKYNGKELDQKHGLNLYDYSARYYEPAIGRFTTVDPLAEKYYSISPYAYVANNPLRFTDPTGMVIDSLSQQEWNTQKNKIVEERDKLVKKNQKGKNDDRIASLNNTLSDMNTIEGSKTIYSLNKVSGTGYLKYDSNTGNMIIEFDGTANFVHEVTHGGQFERGELGFTTTGGALANDIWDEVAAYKAQSAYDPSSTGGRGINKITAKWVKGISDQYGVTIYAPGGSSNTGYHSLNKNSGMYDYLRAYPSQQKQIINTFGIYGLRGGTIGGFNNAIFK